MTSNLPEIELQLSNWDGQSCDVQLRWRGGGLGWVKSIQLPAVSIDLAVLSRLQVTEYGIHLVNKLFQSRTVTAEDSAESGRTAWESLADFLTPSSDQSAELLTSRTHRVRIFVHPTAAALHEVCWELLPLPGDLTEPWRLSTGSVFVRYCEAHPESRPVLRRGRPQRTLVTVARPPIPSEFTRTVASPQRPVNANDEWIAAIPPMTVPPAGEPAISSKSPQADKTSQEKPQTDKTSVKTFEQMTSALKASPGYQVLLLIGRVYRGSAGPVLAFEATPDDQGSSDGGRHFITADALCVQLARLGAQRPWLVVLARGCDDLDVAPLTRDEEMAMLALSARLTESGVPSTLCILGSGTAKSLSDFFTMLWKDLLKHDSLEDAVGTAARSIPKASPSLLPVLFMGTRRNRVWQTPRPISSTLKSKLGEGAVVVLGPRFEGSMWAVSQDLVRQWASRTHNPMQLHYRDNLTAVAQYAHTNQEAVPKRSPSTQQSFRDFMLCECFDTLCSQYESVLQPLLQHKLHVPKQYESWKRRSPEVKILDLLQAIHHHRIASAAGSQLPKLSTDPYDSLADRNIRIFLTTDPSPALRNALLRKNKRPRSYTLHWNQRMSELASREKFLEKFLIEVNAGTKPDEKWTPEEPLIVHLWGHLRDPEFLMLTDDDLHQYIYHTSSIQKELCQLGDLQGVYVFLGFDITDLRFRSVYHLLLPPESIHPNGKPTIVAVEPTESYGLYPDEANNYLAKYLEDNEFEFFWGSHEMLFAV